MIGAVSEEALFSGNRAAYTISASGASYTVLDTSGSDATRTFTGSATLNFLDTTVAVGGTEANPGKAYRIYKAAFNRTPDPDGLGFWLHILDSGVDLDTVATGFINSAEYQSVYGASATNAVTVDRYYRNILGREPEAAGYNFWLGVLDSDPAIKNRVLAAISESSENKDLLASTVAAGITYTAYAPPRSFTLYAGSAVPPVKSIDATGSAAQFNSPRGIAIDGSGNLYVADSGNNSIRKISPQAVVTTLAGLAGSQGRKDGSGTNARFTEPFSLAVDSAGTVYVADTSNHIIRKVTAAGVVTTLAGSGAQGSADGMGTAASFNEPRGIAVDSTGNVYVADYNNSTIRKVTAAGVVTTIAGSAGQQGSTDGTGTASRLKDASGIAVDSAGNVYVADTANRTIRKITSAGVVTTLAGTAGFSGADDGAGTSARFMEPRGIAVDSTGNVYVADYGNSTIRKITAAGVVSTVAGSSLGIGSTDATGSAARFNSPSGVAVDSAGNLFVADTVNSTVRKITAAGVTSTLAGLAGRSSSVDGPLAAARFDDAYASAVDSNGNVYIADATDHTIRKIGSDGMVTTLAGTAGKLGSSDGTGSAALFYGPQGIAVDAAGVVYVADTGNHVVRKITQAGVVSTLAGSAGARGSTNATGTAARFSSPNGVAVDSSGNVYVADTTNGMIRKITPAGVVTTLAGGGGSGFVNATGTAARFAVPFDVAVDALGYVYVCDHGNHAIRKITPAGVVSTLAGSGSGGNSNGTGTAATFRFPSGVAVDAAGVVYVADTDNQVIRRITRDGKVTTIGGTGTVGAVDGSATAASFFNPKDVAVSGSGILYVVDRGNRTIRKGM